MHFSIDDRTCALGVGEFAGFSLGPRDPGQGAVPGVWRAQLGQQWHARLRTRTEAEVAAADDGSTRADAAFEVPFSLSCLHRGWTVTLSGRLDQVVTVFRLPAAAGPAGVTVTLREIKTVAGPLPAEVAALRSDYPEYFIQAAAYLSLLRSAPSALASEGDLSLPPGAALRAELVFVELGTGLAQTVPLSIDDEAIFRTQLERLVGFLESRLAARARLRNLRFSPAFSVLRPGQETVQAELAACLPASDPRPGSPASCLLFQAPTGYGKTGVLLEFALGQLRSGRFSRLIYLTSKATGQLQVTRTLSAMTASEPAADVQAAAPRVPVAAWQVRPKSEHCINPVFHCVRNICGYLSDVEERWPRSGLARFCASPDEARDMDTLRAAGREARICPYEITRAALPFNDVWIGDYNYVFSPDSRGLFYDRLGFSPAETLLVVDEAHNLPSRAADAWSHVASATGAEAASAALQRAQAPTALVLEWEHWTRLLAGLRHTDSLPAADEDDVSDVVRRLAGLVVTTPLDYATLGPQAAEQLWQTIALRDWLAGDFPLPGELAASGNAGSVPRLLWCPRAGELHFTCLDASSLIGRTLRSFGGAILASATLEPRDAFAAACGLEAAAGDPPAPARVEPAERLGKLSRRDRKALKGLTSGAELLKVEESRDSSGPRWLQARAPWREGAYAVAVDARVDTTFQHRSRFFGATAATVEAVCSAAKAGRSLGAVAFFPSYAYAESIVRILGDSHSPARVALQPRGADLAAQAAWVESSLAAADVLFLVLGSSFAESIDLLGGRISHAIVVGPALPEVNPLQHRRLADLEAQGLDHHAAFRRVYQIPGMQKVNQALGRLVRAPGQQAAVLLHCRRFADASYSSLLAPEYQHSAVLSTDEALDRWLQG